MGIRGGRAVTPALLTFLLLLTGARAQDLRRVTSPDGRLEFRIFLAQPETGALYRLAYRLLSGGKPVVDTSFLGLDIHNQEPVLCENVGLIRAQSGSGKDYNWLTAEYMQNGSLGRLVNIEIRVWNDGAAFRYVIPRSTPLEDLLIDDELTEFALTAPSPAATLPLTVQEPEGWVTIAQAVTAGYPQIRLIREEGNVIATHLAPLPGDSGIALETHTPFHTPWRVILIGKDTGAGILRELNR